jgi:hypothetical protein
MLTPVMPVAVGMVMVLTLSQFSSISTPPAVENDTWQQQHCGLQQQQQQLQQYSRHLQHHDPLHKIQGQKN